MKLRLILLASIFTIVACSNQNIDSSSNEKIETDSLTLAVGKEPESGFDPITGWGRYGSPLFQSTLLKLDEDLSYENDLITSYHISRDGLTWTLELREDAKFSDGERLNADDVIFTFEQAQLSQSIVDVTNVDEIEKQSDFSLKIKLKTPQATFLYLLATLGIVPEHAYNDRYQDYPVGTGPYKMVEWKKGEQLIVEENPHYYGKKPSFKKLTFLFLEEDQAFAAAKAGQVDVASVPITYNNQTIDGMKLLSLESVDNRGVILPFLDEGNETAEGIPAGHVVTSNLAIRKAMNLAVDREELVDGVLEGQGTPAYSSVDKLPWWNEDTRIKDDNQELAQEILTSDGWEKNEQGYFEKDELEAGFTLYYPSGDQLRQSLSIVFAEQMQHFGINVVTEGKSWNELENLIFSNPVMMGWGSHDPTELYNLYHSDIKGIDWYNSNLYQNELVDNYLENAMHAKSEEAVNQALKNAQFNGETGLSAKGDASWVWLVNVNHLYFVHEDLKIGEQKIQPHGHGWPVTDFITEWKLKTNE
ncbi:ABC transporter substrate-binding protein [Saliterribacillus persicus]|uniref:Peptide/nickel transport system substrate-binding protein n=1 Tax=Saliterribacillus persicus TaxID=930114 RepID=A0A368Y6A3_9BACI|nr:ABC transporter substrate-binding protein [Saliterribacillus persicus]RCW74878.1 peptide/nickel transport system substrate-binding protein [Saliterribacillus persicus]